MSSWSDSALVYDASDAYGLTDDGGDAGLFGIGKALKKVGGGLMKVAGKVVQAPLSLTKPLTSLGSGVLSKVGGVLPGPLGGLVGSAANIARAAGQGQLPLGQIAALAGQVPGLASQLGPLAGLVAGGPLGALAGQLGPGLLSAVPGLASSIPGILGSIGPAALGQLGGLVPGGLGQLAGLVPGGLGQLAQLGPAALAQLGPALGGLVGGGLVPASMVPGVSQVMDTLGPLADGAMNQGSPLDASGPGGRPPPLMLGGRPGGRPPPMIQQMQRAAIGDRWGVPGALRDADPVARAMIGVSRGYDVLPSDSLRVARALLAQPSLRSLRADDLAVKLSTSPRSTRAGMASLCAALREGDASRLRNQNAMADTIGDETTFDQLVAMHGGSAPASPMGRRPRGARINWIRMHPAKLAELLASIPAARGMSAAHLARATLGHSAAIRSRGEAGALTSDGRSYIAEKGDIGSSIAQKLTGSAGRWTELRDANPATKSAQYGMAFQPGQTLVLPASWVKSAPPAPGGGLVPGGMVPGGLPGGFPMPGAPPIAVGGALPVGGFWEGSRLFYKLQPGDTTAEIMALRWKQPGGGAAIVALNPTNRQGRTWKGMLVGDVVEVPAAWGGGAPPPLPPPPGPPIQPPPVPPTPWIGPTPPPTPPAGEFAAPGGVLQVQVILASWATRTAGSTPVGFGTDITDIGGTWTPRSRAALGSFQSWHNATNGTKLRTDGVLDAATYAALITWTQQQKPIPPQPGIDPTPPPGVLPKPPPGVIPGIIPGKAPPVSVEVGEKSNVGPVLGLLAAGLYFLAS